jgi:hypothetical protein
MAETDLPPPAAGWVAVVEGHSFDLAQWEQLLKQPFDPCCERIPHDGTFVWALRSRQGFDHLDDATAVNDQASTLVAQLNGALRASAGTDPLKLRGVGRVDDEGRLQLFVFAAAVLQGRAMITAVGEVRNPDGSLAPPPPPAPSAPQKWIKIAEENEKVADMLIFAGRADNWFDIYKAIEAAEDLVGSETGLERLLGQSGSAFKLMKHTANSLYRHRPGKFIAPKVPTPLNDAKSLLAFIVRTVMASLLTSATPQN